MINEAWLENFILDFSISYLFLIQNVKKLVPEYFVLFGNKLSCMSPTKHYYSSTDVPRTDPQRNESLSQS